MVHVAAVVYYMLYQLGDQFMLPDLVELQSAAHVNIHGIQERQVHF